MKSLYSLKSLRLLFFCALVIITLALAGFSIYQTEASAAGTAAPLADPTPTVSGAKPKTGNPQQQPDKQNKQSNQNGPKTNTGGMPGSAMGMDLKSCGPMGGMPVPQGKGQNGNNQGQNQPAQGPRGFGGHRQIDLQQCATNALKSLQNRLNETKTDQAFAQGKMDLTLVSPLIAQADALNKQATGANSSGNYTRTVAYAAVAGQTLESAHILMSNILGNQLPSAQNHTQTPSNKPQTPNNAQPNAQLEQANISRVLSRTYAAIKEAIDASNKAGSQAGDLSVYLNTAKALYTQAYQAYQAGNYTDAAKAARAIDPLLAAVNGLFKASGVKLTPSPVTVPAPNF